MAASDGTGIKGIINIVVLDKDGNIKHEETRENLITTVGDQYYAKQGATGVGGNTAPTLAAKMQLGTGTTGEQKSSTGSAVITFKASSGVVFDTVATSAVGGDTGWKIRYTSTWGPGTATDTALTEAVVTTETAVNTASVEAKTLSRVVFSAINKGASDTLVINWDHVFYDAP